MTVSRERVSLHDHVLGIDVAVTVKGLGWLVYGTMAVNRFDTEQFER
jgi:hypothetical protein